MGIVCTTGFHIRRYQLASRSWTSIWDIDVNDAEVPKSRLIEVEENVTLTIVDRLRSIDELELMVDDVNLVFPWNSQPRIDMVPPVPSMADDTLRFFSSRHV